MHPDAGRVDAERDDSWESAADYDHARLYGGVLVRNASADEAWKLISKLGNDDRRRHTINTVIYATILKRYLLI